jgi:putative transposase
MTSIKYENIFEASMSRRGNCHDDAVAESFFSLLKMDRIKRRLFKTRAEARAEIFDYIEFFKTPNDIMVIMTNCRP